MLFNNSNNSYISKVKYVRKQEKKEMTENNCSSIVSGLNHRSIHTAAYANNSRILKPNISRENTADYVVKRNQVLNSGPVINKKGNSLDTKYLPMQPPSLNVSGANYHRSAMSPTHYETQEGY